jgi:hypothetical protein
VNANLTLCVVLWAVLASVVLLLALYRNLLSKGHFTTLHVRASELPLVPGEAAYAHRLDRIDRWGKILTTTAVVYGLVLALAYLYQALPNA